MNEQPSQTQLEIASLTGRIAALETMNATMLAHLFIQFDQPVALAAHILDDVQSRLLAAQQGAPETNWQQREVARVALASFDRVSKSMLALINRISEPAGKA